MGKINSFKDLLAWQRGHLLVLYIYKLTESFPQREQFGITSQMQRAVISITSNIAEGFSRISKKEKIHFYYIALGSLTELENQLLVCRDLKYCNNTESKEGERLIIDVNMLLNGLIRSTKLRTPSS